MKTNKELLTEISFDIIEFQKRYFDGTINFQNFTDYPFDCSFDNIVDGIVAMIASYREVEK